MQNFVKEGKLDAENKRRQAEWERVRKEDDPIEAPEEVFDNRTLYDKLKEQHEIKKAEYEEQYSIKNLVKGLDEDEFEFLNDVNAMKRAREKELALEEKKEIDAVKEALEKSRTIEGSKMSLNKAPVAKASLPSHKKENKQAGLLSNAIKRKSSTTINSDSKTENEAVKSSKKENEDEDEPDNKKPLIRPNIVLGILPGIGDYESSSDSDKDSDSSAEEDEPESLPTSIFTRKINKK